jgi:hypothetical protein
MIIFLALGFGIATSLSAYTARKHRTDAQAYVRDSVDLTDQEKASWKDLINSLN